jgi:tetratricopeptide (TPR) repeat protein
MQPALKLQLGLLGCAAGIIICASSAAAEISFWDRVKHPQLSREEQLYREAERARVPQNELPMDATFDRLLARRTVILIELGDGGRPQLPRWQFLYGEALITAEIDREREGLEWLHAALQAAPDSLLAAKAWTAIGRACAVLGDYAAETAAYDEALQREGDTEGRARLLLYRADSRMRQADLKRAVTDYQRSLGQSRDPATLALAHFGLAVAYDKDDNFPLARTEMQRALSFNAGSPSEPRWVIDSSEVRFRPSYEAHYYRAFALTVDLMEQQGANQGNAVRGSTVRRALGEWDEYLRAAPSDDPWRAKAQRNKQRCDVILQGAMQQAAARPAPRGAAQ